MNQKRRIEALGVANNEVPRHEDWVLAWASPDPDAAIAELERRIEALPPKVRDAYHRSIAQLR